MSVASQNTAPHPNPPPFPSPKLRFECRDLDHPGASAFFENCHPEKCLAKAVATVLSTLYTPLTSNAHIPPTRSVTLVLRALEGVAYTTGIDLDSDHKEIHFSLEYIQGIANRTPERVADEIQGVLVHEMVHAWQWNALGTAPVGLTEGIADFVRLKAGLSPPHWKREGGGSWDAGYQHTGYFLDWVERKFKDGSVRKINDFMRDSKYEESKVWEHIFGKEVKDLWDEYKKGLDEGDKDGGGQEDGGKTAKEAGQEQSREGGVAQNDAAFWSFVKERKGSEETIVLKAVWRTRRHLQKDAEKDDLSTQIESLWSEYERSVDQERVQKGERENQDDEAVVVEKGASTGEASALAARQKGST